MEKQKLYTYDDLIAHFEKDGRNDVVEELKPITVLLRRFIVK